MDFAVFLAAILPEPGGDIQAAAVLFFALLCGHMLGDFPLQGNFLAIGKDRHQDLEKFTGIKWPRSIWLYCLTAHSMIHSGIVWLITGSTTFALAECLLHWVIDLIKGERITNFYGDQSLHVLCKIVYVALLYYGIVSL